MNPKCPPKSKIRILMSVSLTDQLMNSLFNIIHIISQFAYHGVIETKLKNSLMLKFFIYV